jgi:hypothetical protein
MNLLWSTLVPTQTWEQSDHNGYSRGVIISPIFIRAQAIYPLKCETPKLAIIQNWGILVMSAV